MRFIAVLLMSLMAAGCAAQQSLDASGSGPHAMTQPQLLLENVKMIVNATDTDKAAGLRLVRPF
jgi:uncharacterized lipoprotein YajG